MKRTILILVNRPDSGTRRGEGVSGNVSNRVRETTGQWLMNGEKGTKIGLMTGLNIMTGYDQILKG